jgi:hypothetical protein
MQPAHMYAFPIRHTFHGYLTWHLNKLQRAPRSSGSFHPTGLFSIAVISPGSLDFRLGRFLVRYRTEASRPFSRG